MKKLTIEIVELPDNDGYEARIPELGEADRVIKALEKLRRKEYLERGEKK